MRISDWSSDVCSSDLRGQQHDDERDRNPDDALHGCVSIAGTLPQAIGRCAGSPSAGSGSSGSGCDDSQSVTAYRSAGVRRWTIWRSEEHTSELQSLMRISFAVFCLKKQLRTTVHTTRVHTTAP